MARASSGPENNERISDAASAAGVEPRASTATFSPFRASSSAPRAIVREPSERISTMSRATTGGSPGCSASVPSALRTTVAGFSGASLKRMLKNSRALRPAHARVHHDDVGGVAHFRHVIHGYRDALVQAAHASCPGSNATRTSFEATLAIV